MKTTAKLAFSTITVLLIAIASVVVAQAVTVRTDKAEYMPGDTVVVTGTAPAGQWVGISIINPRDKEVDFKMVQAGADGTYRAEFKLPITLPYGDWVAGKYTVRAYVGAVTAETSFTLVAGGKVVGKVVDTQGRPLAEAEILVTETGTKTLSRADGSFELSIPPGKYVLRVSKAGYKSVDIAVEVAVGEVKDVGTIALVSYEELISALENRISALEGRVSGLEQELKQLSQTVAAGIEDLKSLIAAVNTRLDALSRDLTAVSSKVDAVSRAVSDLSVKIDELARSLSDKVDAVSKAISDHDAKVDSALKSLSTKVDDLSKAVTAVSNKVDTVSTKVDVVSNKIDAISNSLGAISKAVSSVQDNVLNISTSVSKVLDVVNKLSPTVEALRTDITGLRTDMTGLRTSVDAVKSSVDATKSELVKSVDTIKSDLAGRIDTASTAGYIAVVFALLAFIMATLSFITIRKVTAAPK
ncbi:MAG: carboxypeptidase regulatory-like domain-containing protein [Zestosphaera sp.]